jgi:hypothetical protein
MFFDYIHKNDILKGFFIVFATSFKLFLIFQNSYIVDYQYCFVFTGIELFGFSLPLWAFFLIGIIAIIVIWKLIKFAIKILLIVIVFFAILIGLDFLNVFDFIQNLFSGIISI